jgi:hypothetical protein
MNATNREETMEHNIKTFSEIEDIIAKALKKVGGRKENDICKYLPVNTGGYMHHFTMRKMKFKQPQELSSLIVKFIIESDKPRALPPKQRAARGSRKKKDQLTFTKQQIERLLSMAKVVGDKEIVSILSPKKSLAVSKRELIQSIRQNRVEPDLWNAYVEANHVMGSILAPEMISSMK